MPRLAANVTMLWNELDFLDRFEAAAKAGFTGVEYLFPYAYPKDVLAERLRRNGLTQALHNLPAGDWAGGDRGIACDPARVAEFRASVPQAIEYATALACSQVNCLAGVVREGVSRDAARETLVANLRYAAPRLADAGIRLLIEPINTFDIPGFFLAHTQQALDIVRDVGSPNLFVQYDVYHMQRMEGELAATLAANLPHIAHVQIADNPGRHEPGTGEIDYRFLLAHLDAIGYTGWVGCEYKPKGGTDEGLAWRQALGVAPAR